MARILLIGGHGKVALLLAPLLVDRGDDVVSVIRDPDHADDVTATGASPLVADIEQLDPDGWRDLVTGHDAIVWSAGAGGGDPARTRAVDNDAAVASMDAAVAAGVDRYVMVSYLGSRPDHGVDAADPFFAYAEAKAAADEHLRSTSLAWTVLGPGRLTLEPPTGTIEVAEAPEASSVPRGDVAAVAAEVLHQPGAAGRTIAFNSGPTPIADAIADVAR